MRRFSNRVKARRQMSDCKNVRGFLNRYFKDELDKKKRLYIETHVKNCIMCSAEMEFAKKRVSVSELWISLQPRASLFRRIGDSPERLKKKIKKTFSKHPVLQPAAIIFLFLFIPAGLYVKSNNIPFKKTDEARDVVYVAKEAKRPAERI